MPPEDIRWPRRGWFVSWAATVKPRWSSRPLHVNANLLLKRQRPTRANPTQEVEVHGCQLDWRAADRTSPLTFYPYPEDAELFAAIHSGILFSDPSMGASEVRDAPEYDYDD